MNSPMSARSSAAVRTRPLVSIEEIRGDKNYPPVPPQAAVLADTLALDPIPLHVRQQRVRNGSKRKRDLAAVAMADELDALEKRLAEEAALRAAGIEADPCRDLRFWVWARRRLRRSLPSPTYRVWIKPLRPAGSVGDCLYLSAPHDICAWTERHYSSLILEALEDSPFTRISFPAHAAVTGREG